MDRVVWIDDDTSVMKETINKVFRPLWEAEIRSEIYILGDAAERRSDQDSLILGLNRVVYDKFISFLISKGSIDKEEEVKRLWSLISYDKNAFIADVTTDKNGLLDKHELGIEEWKKKSSSDEPKEDKRLEGVNKLVDKLFTNEEKVILIDVCLLKNDIENLMKSSDNTNPILSMGLYKVLSERKDFKPFLYTSYAAPDRIVKRWMDVYKETFDDNSKITIYRRDGSVIVPDDNKDKKLYDEIILALGGEKQ